MTTTIQKWGNSQGVRIPKTILETAFFKDNEPVKITAKKNQIIIKKATTQNHKTLKERLKNYNETYIAEEWNTGKTIGKEVL